MNPLDPMLAAIAVAIGGLGAWLVAAPRRRFTRPDDPAGYRPGAVERDSEHGHWLRFVMGPSLIVYALGLAAIVAFGAPAGPSGRAALSFAAVAVPLALNLAVWVKLPAARPLRPLDVAASLSWAAYSGALVYRFLEGPGAHGPGRRILDFAVLAIAMLGAAAMLRSLILNWRDEDFMIENFDDGQGYIERPRLLPLRAKAGLQAMLAVGFIAVATYILVQTLFVPE